MVSSASVGFDPYIALLSPAGKRLAYDTGEYGAFVDYEAPVEGLYTLVVHDSYSDNEGEYRVSLSVSGVITSYSIHYTKLYELLP